MKRTLSIFLSLSIIFAAAFPAAGEIKGPQGAISYKITLPEGFDPARDTCPMVILMHGIFSSKDFIPMPSLAKGLAQAGIGSVRFDFNGHGKSDGRMQDMTIAKEIEDAAAVLVPCGIGRASSRACYRVGFDYLCWLPCGLCPVSSCPAPSCPAPSCPALFCRSATK